MLKITRVLAPTDFSEPSEAAVKYAVTLARQFSAKLYLLHVVAKAPAESMEDIQHPIGLFERMQDSARELLERTLTPHHADDLHSEFATRVGTPQVEIVQYAKDRNIDLIVMGTHGRGFVAHMLMGSVAEHVVRKAPCPVLTVRQPQRDFVVPDVAVAASASLKVGEQPSTPVDPEC